MDQIANPAPGFQRNPGKVITVEPYKGTVTVRAGDVVIASSSKVKVLTESPYPPVFYIPFGDIDFNQLGKTEHSTHCPTRAMPAIGACCPPALPARMRCGPMSGRSTRCQTFAITARSIQTR